MIDLTKELKPLYSPKAGAFAFVAVPKLNFLMIDGEGNPNTAPAYAQTVEALYSVAYTAKFALKRGPGRTDFKVMPLEGLWWADDMEVFLTTSKDAWKWTMMIAMPDVVTAEDIKAAAAAAGAKKALPALAKLRFAAFDEGEAVQTLYIGPYADEGPVIAAMHEFASGHGRKLSGKHHEIYLGDPRRTAPEKLKTIIRQPVA